MAGAAALGSAGSAPLKGDPMYSPASALSGTPSFTGTQTFGSPQLGPDSQFGSGDTGPPVPDPSQTEALKTKFSDIYAGYTKSLEAAQQAINGIKIPQLSVQPFQPPKQGSIMQGWGAAAIAVAAFGSLLTRQPLTTAMNAMASAITSFRKGEQEQLDNSYKIWQANSENAVRMANFELEAYHAALSGVEEKLAIGEKIGEAEQNEILAKLQATAAGFGDSTIPQLIQAGGLPGVVDGLAKRAQAAAGFQENTLKVQQDYEIMSAFKQWQADFLKQNGRKPNASESLAKQKELQNKLPVQDLSPDDIDMRAEMAASGDVLDAYRGLYGPSMSEARKQISDAATEKLKAQGLTGADLAKRVAEFSGSRAFATAAGRRGATIVIASDAAAQIGDIVRDYSDKISRGNVLLVNKALQAFQTQTGDPDLIAFGQALDSFAQSYAKAINPSGASTDASRARAYSRLSTDMTQEQLFNTISVMQAEMRKELNAARSAAGDAPMPEGVQTTPTAPAPTGGDGWSIQPVQ